MATVWLSSIEGKSNVREPKQLYLVAPSYNVPSAIYSNPYVNTYSTEGKYFKYFLISSFLLLIITTIL